MKNNNKVTLKMLQMQMEELKAAKGKGTTSTPIKESYIKKVTYEILNVYVMGILLGICFSPQNSIYIKIIRICFTGLAPQGPWYGKTTWWKILVRLRKLFILFNAAIGVYMVFKTTGFNTENLMIGFWTMGHTYLEIFINFTKRLFNWFVELFDQKIVPNVPNPGHKSYKFWSPRGIDSAWNYNLPDVTRASGQSPDWFRSPINFGLDLQ